MNKDKSKNGSSNKLCTSCRRTCKQAGNAVVAQCLRYYPFNRKQTKHEFNWKQMELVLCCSHSELTASKN